MRVPLLYTEKNSFLHRRDPRIKLLLFAVVIIFLYTAPNWQWMLAASVLGLALSIAARVPPLVLLILWLLQLPNFIGLVAIPLGQELLADDFTPFDGDLTFGLRLGLAWSAALFLSMALLSTMSPDKITDGMRGLKIPEPLCFLVGYSFLLMYASMSDIFRTIDAMKLKGIELTIRRPIESITNMAKLFVPAVIIMARRAGTMMSTLQLRGFSFTHRPATTLGAVGVADVALLVAGVGGLAVAALVRFAPAVLGL
ncbi:energy-coupling factor transporter transmembrane component T family protein [Arthrobacter castelli]|uniref:energy-coupling factor transporter transmembrane component T family protein n=1 Tax=Arthrobacter castelli TaxID=271431 RepID=UPI000424224C|nr:energy-coupling factor transporter transmembrane component T [Arthrobacter castelli]